MNILNDNNERNKEKQNSSTYNNSENKKVNFSSFNTINNKENNNNSLILNYTTNTPTQNQLGSKKLGLNTGISGKKVVSVDLYSHTLNKNSFEKEDREKTFENTKDEMEDFVNFDKSKQDTIDKAKEKIITKQSALDKLFLSKKKLKQQEQKLSKKIDVLTHQGKLDFKLGIKK